MAGGNPYKAFSSCCRTIRINLKTHAVCPIISFGVGDLTGPPLPEVLRAMCMRAKSLQSCPTLCDPMDCSLPGSSAHGTLQARILEWGDIPSSRGSSRPRGQTHSSHGSCTAGGFFISEPVRKPLLTADHSSKLTVPHLGHFEL